MIYRSGGLLSESYLLAFVLLLVPSEEASSHLADFCIILVVAYPKRIGRNYSLIGVYVIEISIR